MLSAIDLVTASCSSIAVAVAMVAVPSFTHSITRMTLAMAWDASRVTS